MQRNSSTSSLNSSRGGGAPNGYLGMTAPISWAGPDKSDEERTKKLIEALQPHGCYETPEELGHRMEVRHTIFTKKKMISSCLEIMIHQCLR